MEDVRDEIGEPAQFGLGRWFTRFRRDPFTEQCQKL